RRTGLENHSCPTRMPVTPGGLQFCKPHITERFEIGVTPFPLFSERLLGHDSEYPTSLTVQDLLTADVSIVPVKHIQSTFGTKFHTEANPLRVVGEKEVVSMSPDKAGALALKDIGQHCMLVNVGHKQATVLTLRKCV